MIKLLGEGKTSRVYLCQEIENPNNEVAIKLIKQQFLESQNDAVQFVEQEIRIYRQIESHKNIISNLDFGFNGTIQKPSGLVIQDLVYIVLEYSSRGDMFALIESAGECGEDGALYLMD